ncbi:hypothetical protein BC941DRAFT_418214 [Chlamydoabsidia padenii]|nr:hypothetical protein BC941DRAFT_418214 [Chlamydoabsidia padenii]
MDYSFYTLVAICIFLLILTFYLAVRRRRNARKRQAQTQNYDPVVNDTYQLNTSGGITTVVNMDIPQQPIVQQGYHTTEYSAMTNRPSPPLGYASSAAYKPENNLPQQPPPSYQDYAKDVRLLHTTTPQ